MIIYPFFRLKDSEKENKTPGLGGSDTNGFGSKSAAFSSNSLTKTDKSAAFSSSKVSETVASFSSSYKVIYFFFDLMQNVPGNDYQGCFKVTFSKLV